ncbi:MAG: ABC transporter related, partial [Acidimicrobiaceae bacterium]
NRTHGPGRYTHRIVRQGLSLAPQGDAIFPGLTVRQNLDAGAYTSSTWRRRRILRAQVLEIFPPLGKLLDTPVGKLSGGERRMVSIGRALMANVSLYLVDEPSLGLAPKISRSVVDALMHIDLASGAMIIAEQDLGLLTGKVDRVLGMYAGELKGATSDGLLTLPSGQSRPR